MQLSQLATVITIGLLFACARGSAEDRLASTSQRYKVHVPREIKFGHLQPAAVNDQNAQLAKEDTESVVFVAETTSGVTIQFEAQSEPSQKLPLKLSVGGSQQGNWWASGANDVKGSTHESVAEATVVQASTHGAGWAMLKIDVANLPAAADTTVTTIVVTIVAH